MQSQVRRKEDPVTFCAADESRGREPSGYVIVPRRMDLSPGARIVAGAIIWAKKTGGMKDADIAAWLGTSTQRVRNVRRAMKKNQPILAGYVRLPVQVLANSSLAATDRLIAAELLGGCDANNLAARIGRSQRTVRRGIKKIREVGKMLICAVKDCPGFGSTYVCKHKQGATQKPEQARGGNSARQRVREVPKKYRAGSMEAACEEIRRDWADLCERSLEEELNRKPPEKCGPNRSRWPQWFVPFGDLIVERLGGIRDLLDTLRQCRTAIELVGHDEAIRSLRGYFASIEPRYFKLSNWASEPRRWIQLEIPSDSRRMQTARMRVVTSADRRRREEMDRERIEKEIAAAQSRPAPQLPQKIDGAPADVLEDLKLALLKGRENRHEASDHEK